MPPSSLLPHHEKRRHPRASLETTVRLSAGPEGRSFQATLRSVDVSLGGIFFQSQYALKLGSELHVAFQLPEGRLVEADGVVVRIEQYDERLRKGRSGFALRFTSFEEDGAIALASLFLAPRLKEFTSQWLRTRDRGRPRSTEIDRLVDLLIAWELERTADEEPEPVAPRLARR
ncbi:MAG TPA: PilZ domain-containing protein [Myxococcales bacterium]|nr:PilZ domain-containing protein [Myxococcales bacterium]